MSKNIFNYAFYNNTLIREEEIYREKNDNTYRGKIYCPECKQAKLTVIGSNKKKALTDLPSIQHKDNCSYRLKQATPKQALLVYSEYNTYKPHAAFEKLFKLMYQSQKGISFGNFVVNVPQNPHKDDSKLRKIAIPMTNFEKINSHILNIEQVFHGRVRTEISKLQNGNYLIKLLAPKSSFQYFTIEVSEKTYKYLPNKLKNPNRSMQKGFDLLYYGKLTEDRRGWKTTKLRTADFIKISVDNPKYQDTKQDNVETDKKNTKFKTKKTQNKKMSFQQQKLLKSKYNR